MISLLYRKMYTIEKQLYGKKEKVSRAQKKKSLCEREAIAEARSLKGEARRGKQNGMRIAIRIPCGSLRSPQEPLAGLILERTQNGLNEPPKFKRRLVVHKNEFGPTEANLGPW